MVVSGFLWNVWWMWVNGRCQPSLRLWQFECSVVHFSEMSFPVYQTTWYHIPEVSIFLLFSALLLSLELPLFWLLVVARVQIFQTSWRHFKIPGTRRVTWSRLCWRPIGATVQSWVTKATWCLWLVHPCVVMRQLARLSCLEVLRRTFGTDRRNFFSH